MSHRRPIPINPFTMYTLWYAREKGYERSVGLRNGERRLEQSSFAGCNKILFSTNSVVWEKIMTLAIYLIHLDISIEIYYFLCYNTRNKKCMINIYLISLKSLSPSLSLSFSL